MSNALYSKSYTFRYKSLRIHLDVKPSSRYSPLIYLTCWNWPVTEMQGQGFHVSRPEILSHFKYDIDIRT